jgi:hypothetical protein
VFSLQTVPARQEELRKGVAQYGGFSLPGGIGVEAEQRGKLERLARYVSRPPVSVERLSLTAQGHVRYRLKTPYRDGTTDIVLEPLDFIAGLAALVPPPRVHLTRYHGVFAANAAMQPDEFLLLKCFDSRVDGRARFTPHTAFENSACPRDFVARESIEVRTLVVFDER